MSLIMMEENLLQQEEEFHRYNAEIELKTNSLMKEAEIIMSEQDYLKYTPTLDLCMLSPDERGKYCETCRKISVECSSQEFGLSKCTISNRSAYGSYMSLQSLKEPLFDVCDKGDVSEGLREEERQENKKLSASDSMIRVLQTKVRVLQCEVNTVRSDSRKKADELEKHKILVKQLDEEKKKVSLQISALKEQISRRHVSISELSAKLREKETENNSLKKEVENLRKELKSLSQIASASDVRLNRALEEVDRLKCALKSSALLEKELQATARKNSEEASILVKKLEKQKAELMHSFRTQVQLIENLKSQMVNYEATMMGTYIKEVFLKLLDCGTISKCSSEKNKDEMKSDMEE